MNQKPGGPRLLPHTVVPAPGQKPLLLQWTELMADMGPLPGEQVVVEDDALREWAIANQVAYAAPGVPYTVVVGQARDSDPDKVLRAAAHGLICKAEPHGIRSDRFVVKASVLRRLERALTAADEAAAKAEES